jgi:hypothetical protein
MIMPWWGWVLVAVWCFPAVHGTFVLLFHEPFRCLTEEGEPVKPVPLSRKLLGFPVVLGLLVIIWPWVYWSEYRHSRG